MQQACTDANIRDIRKSPHRHAEYADSVDVSFCTGHVHKSEFDFHVLKGPSANIVRTPGSHVEDNMGGPRYSLVKYLDRLGLS